MRGEAQVYNRNNMYSLILKKGKLFERKRSYLMAFYKFAIVSSQG